MVCDTMYKYLGPFVNLNMAAWMLREVGDESRLFCFPLTKSILRAYENAATVGDVRIYYGDEGKD